MKTYSKELAFYLLDINGDIVEEFILEARYCYLETEGLTILDIVTLSNKEIDLAKSANLYDYFMEAILAEDKDSLSEPASVVPETWS